MALTPVSDSSANACKTMRKQTFAETFRRYPYGSAFQLQIMGTQLKLACVTRKWLFHETESLEAGEVLGLAESASQGCRREAVRFSAQPGSGCG